LDYREEVCPEYHKRNYIVPPGSLAERGKEKPDVCFEQRAELNGHSIKFWRAGIVLRNAARNEREEKEKEGTRSPGGRGVSGPFLLFHQYSSGFPTSWAKGGGKKRKKSLASEKGVAPQTFYFALRS